MPFITLTQARIDGDDNPKAVILDGLVAFDTESISMFHSIVDKHDVPIEKVVRLMTKDGSSFLVSGNFNQIMEEIKNANLRT